jgi:aryl-alcohol dehydrogenase-like predicted oxidoreductase
MSRIGFGGWSIGGPGWSFTGSADRDAHSVAAMLHAFERGVNWVDTAPVYGRGHSEELVGRALKLIRGDRPMVFTKCGRRWDHPDRAARSDLRPSSIRADCEASLKRLGVDFIDLLQFHWPDHDTGVPIEESWGELLRLVEEGKVRAAGVCNFDVALLEQCEAVGHVDSLQTPLSLIARESAGGLLQACAEHQTSAIVYSPMQVGLLTDSFKPDLVESFESGDWRRRDPEFLPPNLQRNLSLRDALRPIATAHSTTVAAVAVAWTLAWPQVTGAIVGARTSEQVDGWIDGALITLSERDLDAIAAAVEESGAGRGPRRPLKVG